MNLTHMLATLGLKGFDPNVFVDGSGKITLSHGFVSDDRAFVTACEDCIEAEHPGLVAFTKTLNHGTFQISPEYSAVALTLDALKVAIAPAVLEPVYNGKICQKVIPGMARTQKFLDACAMLLGKGIERFEYRADRSFGAKVIVWLL